MARYIKTHFEPQLRSAALVVLESINSTIVSRPKYNQYRKNQWGGQFQGDL